MIRLLTSPRAFDVLILALFAAAAVRWAIAGNLGKALYWSAAFALNFAVVFMMGSGS